MVLKGKIKGTLRPDRYVEVLPVSQGEVMAGRAVLVTGGTSGIGRATVELLVRCRAEVVFTGGPGNRALAEMETELGATAHGIEYDVGRQPVGDLLARAAGVLEGCPTTCSPTPMCTPTARSCGTPTRWSACCV